jgi:hypothetical protein
MTIYPERFEVEHLLEETESDLVDMRHSLMADLERVELALKTKRHGLDIGQVWISRAGLKTRILGFEESFNRGEGQIITHEAELIGMKGRNSLPIEDFLNIYEYYEETQEQKQSAFN